jgi:hypothetical protein
MICVHPDIVNGIGDRNIGPLEVSIIDDVGLAVFAMNYPITALDVPKPGVGGDGGGYWALRCIHEQGPLGSKNTHYYYLRRQSPTFTLGA